jgi:hypothetical protein
MLQRSRIGQIDVLADDALELHLRRTVVVFAFPQGVVAVEADPINSSRHPCLPPFQTRRIPAD